ncbi:MAG TPA: FHA domain-containing protein [Bryobacteraceae bacterium]|nr:FHA domain-containing protein [Bryobacteraceae bacterium]
MPSRTGEEQGRITGKIIIEQLLRNLELGQFEMGYSVLVPCIFSLYLHPDDYARLTGVFDLIREDARRALTQRLEQWNAKPLSLGRLRGSRQRKPYKAACKDWVFEFFPDAEGVVPVGDVEIHSELNETPQPGYHGAKTTLMDREPAVGSVTGRAGGEGAGKHANTRQSAERVYAELRYRDDSGPQLFLMTQDEIAIGRGGDDVSVNLALYTNDEVSREHLRVRRDPAQGRFSIIDKSMNGTWLNGKRLKRGVEETLPARAKISVAEVITLEFEARP